VTSRPAAALAVAVLAILATVAIVEAGSPAARRVGTSSPAAGRPAAPSPPRRGRPRARRPKPVTARQAIRLTFGAGALGACFRSIAWRESRMRPHRTNWQDVHSDGSRGSFGLFQIGAVHRRAGEPVSLFRLRMLVPLANAREARRLYLSDGLRPWGGRC